MFSHDIYVLVLTTTSLKVGCDTNKTLDRSTAKNYNLKVPTFLQDREIIRFRVVDKELPTDALFSSLFYFKLQTFIIVIHPPITQFSCNINGVVL